ncbi:type I methionyl aminopeptidase [Arenicella xantha]|uniref:type I methionyl aminopeptidase n=1 Tax=Arenicella xantha TaxID=644221 RepID=UPI003CCC76E1
MNRPIIKSAAQIEQMREAGRLLAQVFEMLDSIVAPGVTTMQINDAATDYIRQHLRARPASIGQYNYPFALNASINHEVCHGMPSAQRKLQSSDIVNFDITLEKNGYIADSSKMYTLPDAPDNAVRLVEQTYQAMLQGIRSVRPGATLGDIGFAIQRHAELAGYSVVREYCGHGIGREMHEEPQVLHYGRPSTGLVLKPGMTFTIEPMINMGGRHTKLQKDGWTVVTRDNKPSAQWEHTVLVTNRGFEVLTQRAEESISV